MILGDTCTRRCGFCNVKTGKPTHNDPLEPLRVAQSVKKMGLRHAVITSVDRDDLPDLGSSAFVGVIRSVRRFAPGCKVEVLTPDFRGEEMPLARVIAERPDVFNHNVETVPRLYPLARRGSRFLRSCRVLQNAKEMGGDEVVTKSGLMTGLGETKEELIETFGVLRDHGVQVLTVGQYLRPTRDHLPGGALLAPGRVRRARAGGLRARLRVGRRRAAGALELSRRADPRAGCHQHMSARPRALAACVLALCSAWPWRLCCSCPREGAAGTERWRALRDAPLERTEVAAARVGRFVYVAGGFGSGDGATTAAFERYDLRRDRWKRIRDMPVALNTRHCRGSRRAGVRARRLCQRPGAADPVLLRYDPPRDRWRRLASSGVPRAAHAAAVVGDRLYVAAAPTTPARCARWRCTASGRSLDEGPSLPGPARNHTGGVASGRALLRAGRARRRQLSAVERYDPRRRHWQKVATAAHGSGRHRRGAAGRRAHRGLRRRAAHAGGHDDRRGRAVRSAPRALAGAARYAHSPPWPRRRGARAQGLRDRGRPLARASSSPRRSSSSTCPRA